MRATTMVLFLFVFLTAGTALADGIEGEIVAAGGGAPLLPILTDWEDHHSALLTGFVAGRLRAPDHTSFGLEASAVLPFGFGLNGFIDLIHIKKARAHFNFGVFANLIDSVSVMNIDRRFDITGGFGVEIPVSEKIYLTLDWRNFLPWPWETIARYGDFSRPFYDEAFKGGQLWLGVAQSW